MVIGVGMVIVLSARAEARARATVRVSVSDENPAQGYGGFTACSSRLSSSSSYASGSTWDSELCKG